MTTLFDPITIGDLRLPNRIIMAPLTRNRSSGPGRVPNALMRNYYVQRASAGAITTEATSVTPMGVGYPHPRHLVAGAGRRLAPHYRGRS
jgi:2,4-dienoyl-CoA reductase-like NADH-dependent reductase (Old Yellow Enzyme family)